METETDLAFHPTPPGLSAVTATLRSDYAEAVARTVERIAGARGAETEVARDIQAKLLHKVFHWMSREGTHFLDVVPTLGRVARLAARLVDRAVHRRAKETLGYEAEPRPRHRIELGTLLKTWGQLTFAEQRVLRLSDLKYGMEDIALILDVTPNAVEFYRNQARRKIHKAYMELC